MEKYNRIGFLSGNALKIIAAIAMVFDHVGLLFFPSNMLFRIIGRLSFPIFAFMIAEGCKYTKHKFRYFFVITLFAFVFQLFFYIFTRGTYLNVFFVFSIAILLIYSLDDFKKKLFNTKYSEFSATISGLVFVLLFIFSYVINKIYDIDYRFFGIMAPLAVSLFHFKDKENTPLGLLKMDNLFVHLLLLAITMILESYNFWLIQYYSLFGVLILVFYSGKRGKLPLKNFFYIFYPLHLVILYAIYFIINMF